MNIDLIREQFEVIAQEAAMKTVEPELQFPITILDSINNSKEEIKNYVELYQYVVDNEIGLGVYAFQNLNISSDVMRDAKNVDDILYFMNLNEQNSSYIELPKFRSHESHLLTTTKAAIEYILDFVTKEYDYNYTDFSIKDFKFFVEGQLDKPDMGFMVTDCMNKFVADKDKNLSEDYRSHIFVGITNGLNQLSEIVDNLKLNQENKLKP